MLNAQIIKVLTYGENKVRHGLLLSDKMFKYRLKVTVGWDWGEVGIQILLKYWLMVTDGWGRGENRHLVNPNVQEGKDLSKVSNQNPCSSIKITQPPYRARVDEPLLARGEVVDLDGVPGRPVPPQLALRPADPRPPEGGQRGLAKIEGSF